MSPKQVHALICDPDQIGFVVKWVNADLETFQGIVGGYIEAVTTEHCLLYLDEEGKLKGNKINALATKHIDRLVPGFTSHDVLVGTTLWLGTTSSGDSADMPVGEIGKFASTAYGQQSWIKDSEPIALIRWNDDIWVYDAADLFLLNVRDIVQQARRDSDSGEIEVYARISPPAWVELRVEMMDHYNLKLHDERIDRTYG